MKCSICGKVSNTTHRTYNGVWLCDNCFNDVGGSKNWQQIQSMHIQEIQKIIQKKRGITVNYVNMHNKSMINEQTASEKLLLSEIKVLSHMKYSYAVISPLSTRGNNHCPICGHYCIKRKKYVCLLKKAGNSPKVALFKLLYCRICGIPLINDDFVKKIQENNNGYTIERASAGRSLDLEWAVNNIYWRKKGYFFYSVDMIHTSSINIRGPFNKVTIISDKENVCPYCHGAFVQGVTYVLGDTNDTSDFIRVYGAFCTHCQYVFLPENMMSRFERMERKLIVSNTVVTVHQQNEPMDGRRPESKKQPDTLNTLVYHERIHTSQQTEIMIKTAPHITIFVEVLWVYSFIRPGVHKRSVFGITCNKSEENAPEHILHYASEDARELLTAAFYYPREKCGKVMGKMFRVTTVTPRYILGTGNVRKYIPVRLVIKRGGGYYCDGKSPEDVLLYSPFHNRYEIIRATMSGLETCFVDIKLFREFVKQYGNPGIPITTESENSGSYWNLNEESLLKAYGYNVSEKDSMTDSERQQLLAEIVDLKILSVSRVAGHLDFLIRLHSQDSKYANACDKWKRDITFIEKYKVNPQRFLIAIV